MRKLARTVLLFSLAVVMAAPAMAADLTCTLPDGYVSRGIFLCEEMRVRLRIRVADWSNDTCASEFLRVGLLAGDKASTRKAARATVSQAVNDAVDSFNIDFPRVAVVAFCGDTILDTEFGEECDDGNTDDGDGCDASCNIEP